MRKLAVVIAVLGASLLFTQFVWLAPAVNKADKFLFAKKVNLALRRTAHHLLIEKGDSTSRILPVKQLNATTFLVRLEHPFDYNRLPALLQQSLAIHKITDNYDVSVLNCVDGELQLGYNFLDLTERNEVPCGGRKQEPGCYTLQVTFNTAETHSQQAATLWPWALGFLLVGGAYIAWRKSTLPAPATSTTEAVEGVIQIGQTTFNVSNQSLNIAGLTYTLTYRETKLLDLFSRHPNQLLERDFILKSVWEDEGIIVGRSVDVFVSRLRKLLQPDPTIRIVAVHGVGYRLDIRQGESDSSIRS
ncbi:winged helix-turn-helix domain-containing protein [Spirosoma flavum]|uniref:Winged helix-turn-helix domain-containing protein n=1 Tax=Spirosoma flavum TaxID=2048557 RepID=A0ABW6AMP9_9BACT